LLLGLLAAVVSFPMCAFAVGAQIHSVATILVLAAALAVLIVVGTALLARGIARTVPARAERVFVWLAWAEIAGCLVTYAIILGGSTH